MGLLNSKRSGFLFQEGTPPELSLWEPAPSGAQWTLRDFPDRTQRTTAYCLPTRCIGVVSPGQVTKWSLQEGLWVTVGIGGTVKSVNDLPPAGWKKLAALPWPERKDQARELLAFSRPLARLIASMFPIRKGDAVVVIGDKGSRKSEILDQLLQGLAPTGTRWKKMLFRAERAGEVEEEGPDAVRPLAKGVELWAVTMRQREDPDGIVRWLNFFYAVAMGRAITGDDVYVSVDSLEVVAKCMDTIGQSTARSFSSGGIVRSTLDWLAARCIAIAGHPPGNLGSLTVWLSYRAMKSDRGTTSISEDMEGVSPEFIAMLASVKARATLMPVDLVASLSRSAQIGGRQFAEQVWANVAKMIDRLAWHSSNLLAAKIQKLQRKEDQIAEATRKHPYQVTRVTDADKTQIEIEAKERLEHDWVALLGAAENLSSAELVREWDNILRNTWRWAKAIPTDALEAEAEPVVATEPTAEVLAESAATTATPVSVPVQVVPEGPVVAQGPGFVVRRRVKTHPPAPAAPKAVAKPGRGRAACLAESKHQDIAWADLLDGLKPKALVAEPPQSEVGSVSAMVVKATFAEQTALAAPAEPVLLPAPEAIAQPVAEVAEEAPDGDGRPRKPPPQGAALPALSGQELDNAAERLRTSWGAPIRQSPRTYDEEKSS